MCVCVCVAFSRTIESAHVQLRGLLTVFRVLLSIERLNAELVVAFARPGVRLPETPTSGLQYTCSDQEFRLLVLTTAAPIDRGKITKTCMCMCMRFRFEGPWSGGRRCENW